MIRIKRYNSNFEKEPLIAPFGFKGGYLSELWQSVVLLQSENGHMGLGLGTQSVLWSDAAVFANNTEQAGNEMMYKVTTTALDYATEVDWETPMDLINQLIQPVYEDAQRITKNEQLRPTFFLNALVPVDNAAWLLYTAENGLSDFDDMVDADLFPPLSFRHDELANIPLITYGVPVDDVVRLVDEGHFLLKIKIGSDPDKDGDPEKMLEWDKRRLSEIHQAVKDRETPYTELGSILYYLDANGRYPNKDYLMRFLDHAEETGAIERIILLEEPFPEDEEIDVSDIPVTVAADESAELDGQAENRIDMGYGAIALKPIAKTLSMSLRILNTADEYGVTCFCADLTVNPVLLAWNQNVAARLAPLPGVKTGVLESNGRQNYKNWEQMKSYHPRYPAGWIEPKNGIFHLDESFYDTSGGIFEMSEHYRKLVLR